MEKNLGVYCSLCPLFLLQKDYVDASSTYRTKPGYILAGIVGRGTYNKTISTASY